MLQNVFFLNLIFVLNHNFEVLGFHPLTENNYVLLGHVYQTMYIANWFNCIQACHCDPRCTSYNFNKSEAAYGLCELNECGLQDLCDRNKLLIYSPGNVFQKIRDCKKDRSTLNTSRSLESGKSEPSDRPQNVREINKTSSSILITWDAVQNNNNQIYKVVYIRFKRVAGIATKTIKASTVYTNLTGLLHSTRYNISVLASNEYGDGPSSEIVVIRTDQGKPVAPPANVTVVKKTSTSILVTWDEVPYGKKKGRVLQYKVQYKAENENISSIVVNRTTRSLEISDLKQNTHYNITVSAATVKGYGPSSEPLSVFTGQDSPSPPSGFRAVNKTTTSIGLKWDHQPNSAITGYTVNYRSASSDNRNHQITGHEIQEVNIAGLSKNVTYAITIQASDKNGTGPASAPIRVTTSDGSSFQCPADSKGNFKDPDSCFRYYECSDHGQVHHRNCPSGTEYMYSVISSPCHHPSEPFCKV